MRTQVETRGRRTALTAGILAKIRRLEAEHGTRKPPTAAQRASDEAVEAKAARIRSVAAR